MQKKLIKTKVATCIGLSLSSLMAQASESTQEGADIEVIQVTGVRSSLANEIAAKRASDAISDSIIAEDIGKSSDENIAEAISRIAGVSLDAEGNTITVRGIQASLNDIKLNGVSMTSSTNDQAVDLSFFSADMLSRIDVVKSPSANQEEGSLGASINLQTRGPLGSDKDKFLLTTEARYNELNEETTPRFSVAFSKRFSDVFGVTGQVFYDNQIKRQEIFSPNNWQMGHFYDPSTDAEAIDNLSIKSKIIDFDSGEEIDEVVALHGNGGFKNEIVIDDKINEGGSFTFQFKPTDNTDIRLDTTLTRQTKESVSSQYQMRNFHKDSNGVHYVRRQEGQANTMYRYVSAKPGGLLQARQRDTETENKIIGLSVEQFIGDDWTINAKLGYSDTQQDFVQHQSNWIGQGKGDDLCSLDFVNGPVGDLLPEFNTCSSFDGLDPTSLKMNQFRRFVRVVDDVKKSAYFDFDRYFDDSVITSVEFGAKYTQRNKFVRDDVMKLPNDAFADRNFDAVGLTDDNITDGRFLDGITPAGAAKSWLFPNLDETIMKISPEGFAADVFKEDPANTSDLEELSSGAYLQANYEFLDGEIRGNFGVRYAYTKVESINESSISFLSGLDYVEAFMGKEENGGDPTATTYEFENTASNSYDNWLPSATLNWSISEDVLFRVAAARVMARPMVQDLRSNYRLDADDTEQIAKGSGGNPYLKPYLADQYDIALEWYFDEGSLLAANLFYKDYASYVNSMLVYREFSGSDFPLAGEPGAPNCLLDPTSTAEPQPCALVEYKTAGNGGSADIKGLELNYQQHYKFLPGFLQHFGSSINYTYADSDSVSNPDEPDSPFNHLPFAKTSKHSANARIYWENAGISYRLAYAYRSRSIDSVTRGVNTYFTDDRETLDFSANFAISKNFKISFSATNLTNSYHKVVSQLTNPDPLGKYEGYAGIEPEISSDLASLSDERVGRIENFGRSYRLSLRYQF